MDNYKGVEYASLGRFYEGFAPAKKNIGDLYGYIDEDGKWVIVPQFDAADNFYNGRANITINHKYGYIDKNGHYIIPPVFTSASNMFHLDYVCVGIHKKGYVLAITGYLDIYGFVLDDE